MPTTARSGHGWTPRAGGKVTGPSAWDGYAASVVAQAGVRAQDGRVTVELAPRPNLYSQNPISH